MDTWAYVEDPYKNLGQWSPVLLDLRMQSVTITVSSPRCTTMPILVGVTQMMWEAICMSKIWLLGALSMGRCSQSNIFVLGPNRSVHKLIINIHKQTHKWTNSKHRTSPSCQGKTMQQQKYNTGLYNKRCVTWMSDKVNKPLTDK